jgi:formate dehydrogenase major subunit
MIWLKTINELRERKIAYIDGKPYEIGANHTSILKFVKSYVGEKKVPTLCDDPNLAPYGACRVCSVEVALKKMVQQK